MLYTNMLYLSPPLAGRGVPPPHARGGDAHRWHQDGGAGPRRASPPEDGAARALFAARALHGAARALFAARALHGAARALRARAPEAEAGPRRSLLGVRGDGEGRGAAYTALLSHNYSPRLCVRMMCAPNTKA
jgi:hypothetical protein